MLPAYTFSYSVPSKPILTLLFTALSDSDPQVQSNGAFATGMLVENSEVDLSSQYMNLLNALRPLFDVPEGAPAARFNARDNATGAVSRMILKNTAAVPLDQVGFLIFLNDCLFLMFSFFYHLGTTCRHVGSAIEE